MEALFNPTTDANPIKADFSAADTTVIPPHVTGSNPRDAGYLPAGSPGEESQGLDKRQTAQAHATEAGTAETS